MFNSTKSTGWQTWKTGEIVEGYYELIKLVGEPNDNENMDQVKSDAQWAFEDEQGNRVAIWNYKNGPAYTAGKRLSDIRFFSVWSNNIEAWNKFKKESLKW